MSLLRAERRRLVKRRVTKIMTALAVFLLGAVVLTFSLISHKHDAAAYAEGERQAQAVYDQQRGYVTQLREDCERQKSNGSGDTKRFPEDCSTITAPPREAFPADQYLPFQFEFRGQFGYLISVFAGILAMVGFVVGASFIGAEWHSGAMMNLLLWRPRRMSVLATKLGTLVGGMAALTVVLGALWTTAFWLIARYTGSVGTLTAGVWRSFGLTGLRALALILVASVVGFALASLGRHTAMALGVGIGVIIVSEAGLRIVLDAVQVPFQDRWSVSTYVWAWINKKVTLEDYRTCDFSMGVCEPARMAITWPQAGWLFGLTAVVLVAASMWWLRRRDVA